MKSAPNLTFLERRVHMGRAVADAARARADIGATAGQVLLAWNMQGGKGVVTTTAKPERLAEYLGALRPQLRLSVAEMAAIDAAGDNGNGMSHRFCAFLNVHARCPLISPRCMTFHEMAL